MNAFHFTIRGEPVEPPATHPKPFNGLRVNGILKFVGANSFARPPDYVRINSHLPTPHRFFPK
jgi:hypothetical protein